MNLLKHLHRVSVLLLVLIPAIAFAQNTPQTEAGKFRLHKFEQAIGEESYTITPEKGSLILKRISSSRTAARRMSTPNREASRRILQSASHGYRSHGRSV